MWPEKMIEWKKLTTLFLSKLKFKHSLHSGVGKLGAWADYLVQAAGSFAKIKFSYDRSMARTSTLSDHQVGSSKSPRNCQAIQKIYWSFHFLKLVIKNVVNMHRQHDVSASTKHRQKHRGQCFDQNIGKTSHREELENIASLRKMKTAQHYVGNCRETPPPLSHLSHISRNQYLDCNCQYLYIFG